MLTVSPSSAAPKGEATIQPAYFTSSLFVDALRTDANELARTFETECLTMRSESSSSNENFNAFSVFKEIWTRSGWHWLHLKVLEPRSRETFIDVVLRVFIELTKEDNGLLFCVAGVFGLYTFFETQPSTSTPRISRRCEAIPICADHLLRLLKLPEKLKAEQASFAAPHVSLMLDRLKEKFLILPHSSLEPMNPSTLPRERVRQETADADIGLATSTSARRKTGRRSKAEKAQQAKRAATELAKWMDETSRSPDEIPGRNDPAGRASSHGNETTEATHTVLSQRPMASLAAYRSQKTAAINTLTMNSRHDVVDRAGRHVLQRLKEIDASTAERGLDVGAQVGEHSAIARVEKAVENRSVLGLLEGSGLS